MLCYRAINRRSGKVYIGLTAEGLSRRWGRHLRIAARGIGFALHDAIRAHGADAFEVQEFASPIPRTPEALAALEILLIAQEGSIAPGGYNLTMGGDGVNGSPGVGAKISAKMTGRKFTPEHREKLSAAKRGVKRGPLAPEVIAKISAAQKGVPKPRHTPEAKEKCRLAGLKRKPIPISDEHRAKLVALHTGRKASDETRAKMSASAKRWRAALTTNEV